MTFKKLSVVVIALLGIQSSLLCYSARVHSPTWDEVGHLAAGLSHWELGRFELYSVNPPLVRTIAAAPVALLSKPKIAWDFYRSEPSRRSEVYVGRHFIELNGEDSFRHFFYARLALIPVALLGGLLCFLWARDLFGVPAGLFALAMWTFSPSVLAYGGVITPDLSSMVALLGCCYVFSQWLQEPSWVWAVMLACATAIAMLTKSVWLGLPLVFVAIWLPYAIANRFRLAVVASQLSQASANNSVHLQRPLQLGISFALALLFVNGFYGFRGSLKPLGEFTFVSSVFSGNLPQRTGVTPGCPECDEQIAMVAEKGNRFSNTYMASVPIPVPANYLQGIDVQLRDFERGRYDPAWMSYLNGQWQQGGWWYYYIVALFLKIPLAILVLFGISMIAIVVWPPRPGVATAFVCLVVPSVIFFVIVSANTGLNRHVRYALPALPVLIILASQILRLCDRSVVQSPFARRSSFGLAVGAMTWLVVASVGSAPHHLSYFNEFAGGEAGGYKHLCDSNADWGQDLIFVKKWLDTHPDAAEQVHLAYFGAFEPATVGIRYRVSPPISSSVLALRGAGQPCPGWHIISKNYLAGHRMPVPNGRDVIRFQNLNGPSYQHFAAFQPIDTIGGSLLVYHVGAKSHSDPNQSQLRIAKGLK